VRHDTIVPVSILLLLAILAVLGGIVMVASGRGAAMPEADPDRAPYGVLPQDGAVGGEDVERLRFSLAFRGYRMNEVDDVLDRLTSELAVRDARIAQLEAPLRGDPPVEHPPETTASDAESSAEPAGG
jgi:DivIVA domain-containing protein